MELNFIEMLVAKWLNFQGYVTMLRLSFWLKRRGKRPGWSDIDVLGVKENDALFVECKNFLGTGKGVKVVKEIEERLKIGSEYLSSANRFPWLATMKRSFLIVAAYPKNLRSYIKAITLSNLEIKNLVEILNKLIAEYYKRIDKKRLRIGKEDENMGRLLSYLIEIGYIDPDSEQLPSIIDGKVRHKTL